MITWQGEHKLVGQIYFDLRGEHHVGHTIKKLAHNFKILRLYHGPPTIECEPLTYEFCTNSNTSWQAQGESLKIGWKTAGTTERYLHMSLFFVASQCSPGLLIADQSSLCWFWSCLFHPYKQQWYFKPQRWVKIDSNVFKKIVENFRHSTNSTCGLTSDLCEHCHRERDSKRRSSLSDGVNGMVSTVRYISM